MALKWEATEQISRTNCRTLCSEKPVILQLCCKSQRIQHSSSSANEEYSIPTRSGFTKLLAQEEILKPSGLLGILWSLGGSEPTRWDSSEHQFHTCSSSILVCTHRFSSRVPKNACPPFTTSLCHPKGRRGIICQEMRSRDTYLK